MPSIEVSKILEYKFHHSIDYVLVLWKDGTTSWTKVLSLSCRDLICEFVKKALRALKESERSVAEQSRQEKEAQLLDKILVKNLEESQSAETKQLEIINSIMENRKPKPVEEAPFLRCRQTKQLSSISTPKYSASKTGSGYSGAPSTRATNNTPIIPNSKSFVYHPVIYGPCAQKEKTHQTAGTEKFQPSTSNEKLHIKRMAREPMKINSLFVTIDPSTCLSINFYCSDALPVISIDISAASFIAFDVLASRLYSIYLSGAGFSFFPSEESESTPKTAFEDYMRSRRLFLMKKLGECVWILYAPDKRDDLFKVAVKSRFLIFRIENDVFLEELCTMRNFAQAATAWTQETFRFSANILSDFLYKDAGLPQSKTIFPFGNPRSMRHLLNFAKSIGEIVNSIELASAVLIQSSYLDFLHLIPGFYDSLRSYTRFFLESSFGFDEILVSGGMITFSDELIEESELLAVADLIDILARRKGWEIKIKRSTYTTLKKRLASQQSIPECLYKMKNVYKVFKNSVLEDFEGDLRNHLEGRYYKTHRFFLEVSLTKVSDGTVTIDEVSRLVMSM